MALGRGLGELLGEVQNAYELSSSEQNENNVLEIDINLIKANPHQPRKIFDAEKLEELSSSIVEYGLLQPISIIENSKNDYTLVAGERRLRAHKLANLDTIKAIIINIDNLKLREIALIENIQRDDLNIIELSYSYAQLLNEHNMTHEELSKKVFKSRTTITNTLRLLQLSSYVQQFLANDKLTAGHAKVMLGLQEEDQKIVADCITKEKLSVRQAETLIRNMKNEELKKPKNQKKEFDFKILDEVLKTFKKNKLKVKAEKNYFKIEINSQEDIQKIYSYFSNTL